MVLVYARKFGNYRDFNVSIKKHHNPLGVLSRIGLKRFKLLLESYISFPSPKINYVKSAQRMLKKIIQSDLDKGDRVCILNSLPPHDLALVGLYLKKRFPEIHWIVDWRDLWSYDERYFYITPRIYRKRLKRVEYAVLSNCDMNITTNDAAKRVLENLYNVPPQKVTSINHAYVPSDFQGIDSIGIKQANASVNGTINIGFLGSLFKPPKVPGLQVLKAIKHASDSGIDVVLNIFGDSKKDTIDAVNNTYKDVAVLYEKVSHRQSLCNVSECDFLLVALSDLPNCHIIYPAKLPHYLMLGKPIIAIVPDESAVANIIRETNSGYVIPSNEDWGKELVRILLGYKNNGMDLKRNEKAIDRYSWENVSKDWNNVINNVFIS